MKSETRIPEVFLPIEEVSINQLKIRLNYFKQGGLHKPKQAVEAIQTFLNDWKQKGLHKKLHPALSWEDFCRVELNLTPEQIEAMDVVKAHDLAELEEILVRLTNKLINKLENTPEVNCQGISNTDNYKQREKPVNINGFKKEQKTSISHSPDSQEYIFARLKRDAELGDSKAKEVVEKVKNGVYTSARQVALEMGYRKPVKQKCLPKDTKKAVEKIVRELGEDYATQLALEILGKNKN